MPLSSLRYFVFSGFSAIHGAFIFVKSVLGTANAAGPDIRTERVRFAKGETSAVIKRQVRGTIQWICSELPAHSPSALPYEWTGHRSLSGYYATEPL